MLLLKIYIGQFIGTPGIKVFKSRFRPGIKLFKSRFRPGLSFSNPDVFEFQVCFKPGIENLNVDSTFHVS